jgi:hypothetical protein
MSERIEAEIVWNKKQLLAAIDSGNVALANNFLKVLLLLYEDLKSEHEREHQRQQSKRQRIEGNDEVLSIVTAINSKVSELATKVVELNSSVAKLDIKVDDANTILPDRYVEGVRLASVNVLNATGNSIGVALFVTRRRIISALHIFTEHYGRGDNAIHGLMHRPNDQEERVTFRPVNLDERFDLAVLELGDAYGDANYSLTLPAANSNRIRKDNVGKNQTKLAVISFTSAVANQAPDAVDVSFCVIPAALIKLTPHHLMYTSTLFSGDSGGAVLVASDGSLRGLHLKTVNQANEEFRIGAPTEEMVASILSLISGLSSGFIGLRLDAQAVQDIILKV